MHAFFMKLFDLHCCFNALKTNLSFEFRIQGKNNRLRGFNNLTTGRQTHSQTDLT